MKKIIQKTNLPLAITIIASALLAILNFNSFQTGALYDDAHYIVLAKSVGSGQGTRLINFPDAPSEWAFPPGWPLLLSPIVVLFPDNYQILKLISLILWLTSIFLFHRFFARHIKTPYLELLVALIALNPFLIRISTSVMSESAYIFFSISTIFLFDIWGDSQEYGKKSTNWLILTAIALLAVYTQLIRTVGISIMMALIGYLFLSRRFRHAGIMTLTMIIGMLPQFFLNLQNGDGIVSAGYQSEVFSGSISEKFWHAWLNLQTYLNQIIANTLIPMFVPSIKSAFASHGLAILPSIINIAILILISTGFFLASRKLSLIEIYVGIFFLGTLNFWNPEVGSTQARYLFPIIPFLYFYLLQAVVWFMERVFRSQHKIPTVLVTGFFTLIMVISVARNIQAWRNPVRDRMVDLSIGTTWIAENTPPESIIMSVNPVPHYLYANRKTVGYPDEKQSVEQYIRGNNVDYIIVSEELKALRTNELSDYTTNYLLPELTSHSDRYKLVFINTAQNVIVYEVIK